MERREWRQGRIENLNAGMQAAGLEGWGESYYVRTRQQLRADLLEARNTAGLKLAQFSTARQQREILSNIRLHDQECFERDQARREQARVDELFLIRRSHLSRSGD